MPKANVVVPRSRRREDGAVAVEFALIVPLLLLLVFGIIQYGLYFFELQGTAAAAREGARQAAVGRDCLAVRNVVEARSLASSGETDVDIVYPSPLKVGGDVRVTVTIPATDLQLPLIPFPGGVTISQDGVTRLEKVPTNTNNCSE